MSDQIKRITPAEAKAQTAGATPLAPGIWLDRNDCVHFSVPELLAAFGEADTPANRARMTTVIRRLLAERFPNAAGVIEQQLLPDDKAQS